jgi:Flp pilus assembly protein CpaB
MDPTRLRQRLAPHRPAGRGGAPIVLPAIVDAASERWWRLPPRRRGVLLVLLVVGALALVGRGATTSPWGPPRDVLVATTDLAGGQRLTPQHTRSVPWPASLVPDGALAADDLAGDLRLAGPVPVGTVLARHHAVTGVAGLVDAGRAAVAVPVDGLPAVPAGTRVELVATAPDGSGHRVASDARVAAVAPDVTWLDVPADRVAAVAAAGAAGRLTLAVRPARPP